MVDHFTIWLSEEEFETGFMVPVLQLSVEKKFNHTTNKCITQTGGKLHG